MMNGLINERRLAAYGLAFLMVAVGFFALTNLAQAQEDVLIVGIQNDTVGLNPWDTGTNSIWKTYIYRDWVFETLYTGTPAGDNVPLLADPALGGNLPLEAPGVDWDGDMNFTVYIRQGVTFTDGNALDADDVVFSYQNLAYNAVIGEGTLDIALSHDQPVAPRWDGGAIASKIGVFKEDQFTVRFWLAQPYWGVFESVIGGAPIMPSHIWSDKLVQIDVDGNVEFDFNADFGANNELQATVGTGPWVLESYTQFVGAELTLYSGYWGAGESITWAGVDYPFLPENVDRISIKIFGTLDIALLALSRGDVHIVPWNTGPSYYNSLSTNPNIDFTIATDSGFFYLAFNMRKEPMSLWGDNTVGTDKDPINSAFRRAVGHAIDKDFIVDRLMGGFGVKGTVPMGVLNPGYVNASAVPPVFDLTAASALLDDPLGDGTAAGENDDAFLDTDNDGWRDLPVSKGGGRLQFAILTPPKDYDPIRADSGIMISKNLKSIGLNIDASPTSFDTIVTQAFVTFDFDLYILGWGLGSFPENYLRTFFGTGGGNNAPGYNNPAYDELMDLMDVEFDTPTRQQIIRDAAGLLVEDLPNDVLYYRQSIVATRQDQWVGWVPDGTGEPYSFYSISKLARPTGPVLPTPDLDVSLNLPSAGAALTSIDAQVLVTQGNLPVSGAAVAINWSFGPDMTATTNANGVATVTVPLPFVSGAITLAATATSGGVAGGEVASILVIPQTPIAKLDLSVSPAVIGPTDTATITASVIDQNGDGMPGVTVTVDPEVLVGTVDANSKVTNASGGATFTYTPPLGAVLLNRHIYDLFKASISVSDVLVPAVQEGSLLIGIDNPDRDWNIIDIWNVTNKSVTMGQQTEITLRLMDADGTALSDENVIMSMSGNTSAFIAAAMNQTTNATGDATFILTGNVSATNETDHTVLTFNHDSALSISDAVALIAWNGTKDNFGRAALVDYSVRVVDPGLSTSVTVTVWNETEEAPWQLEFNETGVPTGNLTGTNVSYTLPFAPVGLPGHFAPGTYLWFLGSVADGVTNMTTGTDGQSITAQSFANDVVSALSVAIQAPATNETTGNWTGLTDLYSVETGFVVGRTKMAGLASVSFDKEFVSFSDASTRLTMNFVDDDGPVAGVKVHLYDAIPPPATFRPTQRLASLIGEFTTTADGSITVPVSVEQLGADFGFGFSVLFVDSDYASGFFNPDVDFWEGALPFEFRLPYLAVSDALLVTGTTSDPVVKVGSSATFSLTVTDLFGNPMEGATVVGGTATGRTAADGSVSLDVPLGAGINAITFAATLGNIAGGIRLGAIGGIGSFAFANQVVPATVTQGSSATLSVDVTNSGPVSDTVVVDLVIDGVVVASKVVDVAAGATVTVTFDWAFTDAGDHTVSIGGQPVVTVSAAAAVVGLDLTLAIVLMVVLLIVGILVGWTIFRMRGGRGGGSPPSTE